MNDGDCCRVEAEVILGFSQLELHNILLTIDYFQKSRIPFLTKSPRMMEKSDIKNASLIICFEKSTYEKIQKGMVFSYKTSPISRFRSCLCFIFLEHLNGGRNKLKSGYGTGALIQSNKTIIIFLKDFFFFSLRRLRQQPDQHSASRLLSPKVDTAQTEYHH